MESHFTPIEDTAALDALYAASAERPVILFKHDPYCPISRRAYQEMERVEGEVAIVDVANDEAIKRAVTERTGIRHESPQVIVLRDGAPVWSASHFRIKADDVTRATRRDETD